MNVLGLWVNYSFMFIITTGLFLIGSVPLIFADAQLTAKSVPPIQINPPQPIQINPPQSQQVTTASTTESAVQLNLKGPYYKLGEQLVGSGKIIFDNGVAVGTNLPRGMPARIEIDDPTGEPIIVDPIPLFDDKFSFSYSTGGQCNQ